MPKAETERIRFTKAQLEKLQPGKVRRYVYDETCPSLAMGIMPTGTKVFYRYGRIHGRTKRIRIGTFPQVSIDDARDAARQHSGEIASGKDPSVGRIKKRTRTVLDVFRFWLENHAKINNRTWAGDERRFELYLTDWKDRPIDSVPKADVIERQTMAKNTRGPIAANRQLRILRAIYQTAIEHDWVTVDPTAGVKAFPRKSRTRFLKADELQAFLTEVITLERPTTRDCLLCCLWTGQRRGNVAAMRWDELDLDAGTWRIPAEKFKNKREHFLPLSKPAVEILQRRFESRDPACPWVFPGGGKSGHLECPKAAWATILKNTGLADLKIHDLRHTMASWQVSTGSSLALIGALLGHRAPSSTAIYAHADVGPVRASVDAAAAAMQATAKKKSKES